MADNYKKGRYTKYSNKIGLYSNSQQGFINSSPDVVLNFPFKDSILEGGMSKEDIGRDERFLNIEIDQADIDTLEDPKVLTNFKYIDKTGEKKLEASSNIEFFDSEGSLKQNLLIKGNNLLALYTLREKLAGKVKLIYIDPPYNTGNDGFKYNDRFNHSAWLTFMKNRLEVAREMLSDDGSIFIQLDNNEVHYAKVLMDEIFGRENFQREIIWRLDGLAGYKSLIRNFVRGHETILFYSKSSEFNFNKQYLPYDEKQIKRFSSTDGNGRKYKTLSGDRRLYLDEAKGLPISDVWSDIASFQTVVNSTEIVKNFIGQKPEKLIERIISSTTGEGDLVLDYHLGTGTTAAVAHKMNRHWVGVEQMDYIEEVAKERLREVVAGEQGGVSKQIGWSGGGSFVYLELKKYNQEFIDRIVEAKSMGELDEVYNEMAKNAFLKFWFDKKDFEKDENFRSLSLDKRKEKLIEILDENQLYLNYQDMDDRKHKVSEDERELTKRFYGE